MPGPMSGISAAAANALIAAGIASVDAMIFKGVIDCSGNPNYPAADRGWSYRVSVAGKIGGASGVNVEPGDLLICLTDGTVSGNQATVGSAWTISQTNLDGAVIGPASATADNFALFSGTTGKLLKDGPSLADIVAAAVAAIPAGPAVLFDRINSVSSTNANGTEDDLFTDTIAGGTITTAGQKLEESESVSTTSSATATRRIRKYFAGTTIWDSGSLTLAIGSQFSVRTVIYVTHVDGFGGSDAATAVVTVVSTSASTVPYVTITTLTSLDFTGGVILKTTGTAGGTGAAPGDIVNRVGTISVVPAGATVE